MSIANFQLPAEIYTAKICIKKLSIFPSVRGVRNVGSCPTKNFKVYPYMYIYKYV